MENIICIDLKMFNHIKLKEICENYDLDYGSLLQNKYDGFAKLWIDIEKKIIISYTTKKDSTIQPTQSFQEILSKVEPVPVPKLQPVLNVDLILDKINKYGIDSIRKEERDFLDSLE